MITNRPGQNIQKETEILHSHWQEQIRISITLDTIKMRFHIWTQSRHMTPRRRTIVVSITNVRIQVEIKT